MMLQEKRWELLAIDQDVVRRLQESLKIRVDLCRLLAIRGITDFNTAKDFFRPTKELLHDPFLMKGMTAAVKRILNAVRSGQKIMVYGDYDVDGTTSVAVVYSFLKKNFSTLPLLYYIPDRFKEGYGISFKGIDEAENQNCHLIIALDCGIKSVEKTDYARKKGIDLIICDHHLPGEELPAAYAILNPKQKNCPYPFKELSGCGIGFKLIQAIALKLDLPAESYWQYLDLVATSIGADIVPITGENRTLALLGLKRANENPCLALRKIKEITALQRDFTISDLVFLVAPRINAAGRLSDAGKAVSLFIEEDLGQAEEKSRQLNKLNTDRKETGDRMIQEAIALMEKEDPEGKRKSTVLYNPDWHKGIVGIVASKVMETRYRPTIILTASNGKIAGSARSVRGFNIYEALKKCEGKLEQFGGHFFAAGMTILPENLEAFKNRFEEVVSSTIQEESLFPTIEIDTEIEFETIDDSFFKILKQFEPSGPENPQPVFMARNVHNYQGWSKIVKEEHLRFVVKQDRGPMFTGIGFHLAEKYPLVCSGAPFDLVFHIDENEWNGKKNLQLRVLDVKASKTNPL